MGITDNLVKPWVRPAIMGHPGCPVMAGRTQGTPGPWSHLARCRNKTRHPKIAAYDVEIVCVHFVQDTEFNSLSA